MKPEERKQLDVVPTAGIRQAVASDPFLLRYRDEKYRRHIRRPWMALGFKAEIARRILGGEYKTLQSGTPQQAIDALASTVYTAHTHLWTDRMTKAFMKSTEHPRVTIGDGPLMSFPVQLFVFEHPWSSPAAPGGVAQAAAFEWILLTEEQAGLSLFVGGEGVGDGTKILPIIGLRRGSVFPDNYPYGSGRFPADFALSALAFLRSRYVRITSSRPQSIQPPVGASDREPVAQEVSVVTLRHPTLAESSDGSEGQRKYKHQWWVGGHYRRQFYPSENAHHFAWIAPYVKGPVGAPMLPRVYAVSR